MKANQVAVLAVCFIMIQGGHCKARKRTTSCTIPESVRGSWKENFSGTEAEVQLKVDIGVTSAKLHIDVENTKSEAEFDCLAEGDGYFLTKESVPSVIKKWSDIRAFYALKKYACFKFDKSNDFLKINMYSFDEKPTKTDAKKVCTGMDEKESFNTIGFSPADQPTN
ncbi:uncharacterized protein LOC141881082 [Acropora palmata]|uniref:uncharacterized protein LOC141881082 n=1 Tax=Acropora palmata TaxID=6131 RepID=UPI003DA02C09